MKRIIGIIALLFIGFSSNAQSFDEIFNTSYNVFSKMEDQPENGNIQSNRSSLFKAYLAGPPIELKKLRIIYNGEYKWFQNDFTGRDGQALIFARNLHDIRLTTIFNYRLNKFWALNYVNFSTVKSDFNNFNFINAYKGINAVTIGLHPKGEDNFRFGIGVTRSREMGERIIIPVGFFYYKTDKWLIDLMYPRLNVFYKPEKKLEYGFMVNYDIGAFDVDFDQEAVKDWDVKPAYQTVTNLTFTPQINFYITKDVNIYARVGVNVLCESGLMDKDYHEIKKNSYEAKKLVPVFGAGLTVKIPHD